MLDDSIYKILKKVIKKVHSTSLENLTKEFLNQSFLPFTTFNPLIMPHK
jgi:hypothetical protein